jgi:hypothetical protein
MIMSDCIEVGCQGWNYEDWVTGPAGGEGVFYPRGTRPSEMLETYARVFRTVEVDSTFYRSARGVLRPREPARRQTGIGAHTVAAAIRDVAGEPARSKGFPAASAARDALQHRVSPI